MTASGSTGGVRAADSTTANAEMQVVHVFAKNAFEEIWTYLQPFRGQLLAHVRTFTLGDEEKMLPTIKGITVSPDDVPKLAEAFTALADAVQERKA